MSRTTWQLLTDGVAALLALNAGVVIVLLVANHDPQRARVNPAIYPAMRGIERRCREAVARTRACERVLELERWCRSDRGHCTDADYHRELAAAGFRLPPLYLSR